jgi:hypothetical protein
MARMPLGRRVMRAGNMRQKFDPKLQVHLPVLIADLQKEILTHRENRRWRPLARRRGFCAPIFAAVWRFCALLGVRPVGQCCAAPETQSFAAIIDVFALKKRSRPA